MNGINISRLCRLAKEGAWVAGGQIAAVAGSLVLVKELTHYLAPAQYGQLALGLTAAGLVNQVVMGGIIAGIGRFFAIAVEKKDLPGYLSASKRLMGFASLAVLAIAVVLMIGLVLLGYLQWLSLVLATLLFSIVGSYNSALSGIQNAARQRAIIAFHGGLDAWLKILLAVSCVLWLGASSTAVVVGYAISSLLVTVSQLFFLRHAISPHAKSAPDSPQWVGQMWAYSWPFVTWGIFTWLHQASDRWALQAFASSADVGQYAVLFQLGYTPIALVTGMAMNFLGPILYQRAGDATDAARNENVHRLSVQMAQLALVVTLMGVGLTLVIHAFLFQLLVAPQYHASSYLLPWVMLAGGLFATGQVLALKLMSDMKLLAMTRIKIATAVVGTLINIVGAAHSGIRGVVAAQVAFSAVYLTWMMVESKRLQK
jgi:O-antigen/teichoic acid export membrane protein